MATAVVVVEAVEVLRVQVKKVKWELEQKWRQWHHSQAHLAFSRH